jgi:hypothetical protein
MEAYIGGVVLLGLAAAMIFYGKARNGVPRPFLQSYPVGVAYISTTMALLVLGIVWIVFGTQ